MPNILHSSRIYIVLRIKFYLKRWTPTWTTYSCFCSGSVIWSSGIQVSSAEREALDARAPALAGCWPPPPTYVRLSTNRNVNPKVTLAINKRVNLRMMTDSRTLKTLIKIINELDR